MADRIKSMSAPTRSVIVALLVALAVSALGWWTHVRSVMYGALLFLLAGALLPFLVLAALLALLCCAAFAAALSGEGDLHAGAPEAAGIAEAWNRFSSCITACSPNNGARYFGVLLWAA